MKTAGRTNRVLNVLLAIAGLTVPATAAAGGTLSVAATTGMVADLVRQAGGDRVNVTQLMGPGVDPHLYKTTSADAAKLGRADVIFYNGLKLEGRMASLLAKLSRVGKPVHAITESIPENLLLQPADSASSGKFCHNKWILLLNQPANLNFASSSA